MTHFKPPQPIDVDHRAEFERFARRQANGEVFDAPARLPDEERRLHIRRTLREDHRFRIENRPEGAQGKFDTLSGSLFSFFRGTALLYYRDQAGTDAHLPMVFSIGDIHPENFGVMPNADGVPFFGVNDFDEAHVAPFSWDVKRGALGFYLAGRENGFSKKKCRKFARAFVRGYLHELADYARSDREKTHQFRIDNSPSMIRDLLEDAMQSREEFLEDLIDLDKGLFVPTDEVIPRSGDVDRFQGIIEHYVETSGIDTGGRAGHFRVKDVALKTGSGTASLGLDRWFILIDGGSEDHRDDIVLEAKQARRSALHGLVPGVEPGSEAHAARIVQSQNIHLVAGDPYYGHTEIDGRSFLVRERSPYKDDIDIDDLDGSDMKIYAWICGRTLAQPHARSDADTGVMEGDAEGRILDAIEPGLFVADVVGFAEVTAKRVKRDHKLFRKDHELGAFHFVE
jgi:uncharacterized protein (DUF2252 family)